jgi:hypothetical protein
MAQAASPCSDGIVPRSIQWLRTTWVAGAVTLAGTPSPASSEDAPPSPVACVVPVFLDDDATLRAAYDGLRAGLEEANLPRACLRPVDPDTDEGWAKALAAVAAEKPPFVVAMGRRASERMAAVPSVVVGHVPCVYVDLALAAGSDVSPLSPARPTPSAVVRAEVSFERLGRVVADLLPHGTEPVLRLTSVPYLFGAEPFDMEKAGRFRVRGAGPSPHFLLTGLDFAAHGQVELRPAPPPARRLADAVADARASWSPLISLDRAHFGSGAAVVVVPDATLLGRTAAEACRRLVDGDGVHEPLRLTVRTVEVWVDLDAAATQGLRPPIPFLARADRIRARKPTTAAPR